MRTSLLVQASARWSGVRVEPIGAGLALQSDARQGLQPRPIDAPVSSCKDCQRGGRTLNLSENSRGPSQVSKEPAHQEVLSRPGQPEPARPRNWPGRCIHRLAAGRISHHRPHKRQTWPGLRRLAGGPSVGTPGRLQAKFAIRRRSYITHVILRVRHEGGGFGPHRGRRSSESGWERTNQAEDSQGRVQTSSTTIRQRQRPRGRRTRDWLSRSRA